MWLDSTNTSDLVNKIVVFSAPGAHMSWVAAIVGFTFEKWGLEDMIREDGSAHNVKDMLPHFSRTGKPFTIENYDEYLEDNLNYNTFPTVYHDGFSNAEDARMWVRVLGEYGNRRNDVVLIPIIAANVQEAMYALLNVGSKGADNEMGFLQKLTKVSDDGTRTLDEVYHEMSRSVMRPWASWSGMHVPHNASGHCYSIYDVLLGDIPGLITNDLKRNYVRAIAQRYFELNKPNWELSKMLAYNDISHWKRPETATATVLTHLMARRRFNRHIPVSWDWTQPLSIDKLDKSEAEITDFGELEPELHKKLKQG